MGATQCGLCVDDDDDERKERLIKKDRNTKSSKGYQNTIDPQLQSKKVRANCNKYKDKAEFIDDCIKQLNGSCSCDDKQTTEIMTYMVQDTVTKLETIKEEKDDEDSDSDDDDDDDVEVFRFVRILTDRVLASFLDSVVDKLDDIEDFVVFKVNFLRTLRSLPILSSLVDDEDINDAVPEDVITESGIYNNWALSVKFKPYKFKYVYCKKDIVDGILEGVSLGCRVRCCQYGHSFAELYGDNMDEEIKYYLLIFLPPSLTTTNPQKSPILMQQVYEGDNLEYTYIKKHKELMFVRDIGNNQVTVGGGTPIWMYFNWAHKRYENGYKFPSETCNVLQKHQVF